jgi:hypothetical protein
MEFRRHGDVGFLDNGARGNVVKWGLGGRRVGQKLLVDIQHVLRTADLTGGLGRLAVVEMGYSFFQRLGTLGEYFVTEKSDQ